MEETRGYFYSNTDKIHDKKPSRKQYLWMKNDEFSELTISPFYIHCNNGIKTQL